MQPGWSHALELHTAVCSSQQGQQQLQHLPVIHSPGLHSEAQQQRWSGPLQLPADDMRSQQPWQQQQQPALSMSGLQSSAQQQGWPGSMAARLRDMEAVTAAFGSSAASAMAAMETRLDLLRRESREQVGFCCKLWLSVLLSWARCHTLQAQKGSSVGSCVSGLRASCCKLMLSAVLSWAQDHMLQAETRMQVC